MLFSFQRTNFACYKKIVFPPDCYAHDPEKDIYIVILFLCQGKTLLHAKSIDTGNTFYKIILVHKLYHGMLFTLNIITKNRILASRGCCNKPL